ELAWAAVRRRRAPIGQVLLDQAVVAGVGNVFRAEALFVHGISPERPATAVDRATWDGLWATLAAMLRRGVTDRRIITVDPAEVGRRSRSRLPRRLATYVYRQEHCVRCGTPVRRWLLGGRWAYACPKDQPD
nr:Fpg/Nei family DNA glycosylase [Acidimicrobiia bacterium]